MDPVLFITEVINAILRHGWSLTTLVVAVTALLRVNGIRKIILRRLPKRFRYEDRLERVERKIDALSAHMGVSVSIPLEIGISGARSCRKPSVLYSPGMFLVNQLGRVKKMSNGINWYTLTVGVLGAIKLVLQSFQIDIVTDDHINAIANGTAALAAVIGVLMSHRKQPAKVEETASGENDYH